MPISPAAEKSRIFHVTMASHWPLKAASSTMSSRAVEMLKEEIESMGPVRIKEVEAAQQQIIGIIHQLENEGVINLKGAGGDQYVV